MTEAKELRVFSKWCAKHSMSRRGNLLRFIGASFVMLVLCNAVLYVFDTVCLFTVGDYTLPLILCELFLLFLVAAPLLMGLRRMAYLMAEGAKTRLSDILFFFGGKPMRDAYLLSLMGIFRLSFLTVISFCLGKGAAVYIEGSDVPFYSDLAILLSFVAFCLLFGVGGRSTLLSTAYFKSGALTSAWKMTAGHGLVGMRDMTLFSISFLPLMLLSVLTLGILFFVYILPLYMIGRQVLAACIIGSFNKENLRK